MNRSVIAATLILGSLLAVPARAQTLGQCPGDFFHQSNWPWTART